MTNPNSDTNETKPGQIPPHLLDGLTSIAKSVSTAYSQLIASLEPQVLRLIHANNTDVDFIESLLDQLLDICDDDHLEALPFAMSALLDDFSNEHSLLYQCLSLNVGK